MDTHRTLPPKCTCMRCACGLGEVLLAAIKGDSSRQDGKWSNGRNKKIELHLGKTDLSDAMKAQLKEAMGGEKTRTYEVRMD